MQQPTPGQIIILNGAPRSGKSSIVSEIQATFEGVWMNLGVDVFVRGVTPQRYRPGVGLRPGEAAHPIAPLVPLLYAAMYDSIAAHSKLGLNVAVDVGHHDAEILRECARRLDRLPVLFVGIRCPIEVIMERRNAGQLGREGDYVRSASDDPVPSPVQLWQQAVHQPGIYDLEVDTSELTPEECAVAIRRRLEEGPGTAFKQLAAETPAAQA